MKSKISLFLCFSLLFILAGELLSPAVVEMHVKIASKNLIVANKGKNQGVQKNTIYTINREGQIIGKAKVMLIEDNLSGLKVIDITPGFYVKDGDILIINLQKNHPKQEEDNGYIYRPLRPNYCLSQSTNFFPT